MNISVSDLACIQCARAVTRALHDVNPQARFTVDLVAKSVTLHGGLDATQAMAAIQAAGYSASATNKRTSSIAIAGRCGCCSCEDCACTDCQCCTGSDCRCAA